MSAEGSSSRLHECCIVGDVGTRFFFFYKEKEGVNLERLSSSATSISIFCQVEFILFVLTDNDTNTIFLFYFSSFSVVYFSIHFMFDIISIQKQKKGNRSSLSLYADSRWI